MGFVLAIGRIQPMLELFETGSILGVILVPLSLCGEYEHADILSNSLQLIGKVLGWQS